MKTSHQTDTACLVCSLSGYNSPQLVPREQNLFPHILSSQALRSQFCVICSHYIDTLEIIQCA